MQKSLVLFHNFRFHYLYLFAAATLLFALHAGGLKSSGLILVELIEQYDGVYSQATLLWVLTIKYTVFGLIGELNNTVQCNSMQFNGMQWDAMRYNAMQCDAMRCNAMQCNEMQ